jgi:hypothetical protein
MGLQYKIFDAENLLVARHVGVVDGQAIARFVQAIDNDPDYRKGLDFLTDASELEQSLWDAKDALGFVQRLQQRRREGMPDVRQAIVAPTDLGYGMGRVYLGFAEAVPWMDVNLFRESGDALAWLGLKHPFEHYLGGKDWKEV